MWVLLTWVLLSIGIYMGWQLRKAWERRPVKDDRDGARDSLADVLLLREGGWRCGACQRVRPDNRITVAQAKRTWGVGGAEFTCNVRHCTDNKVCTERAAEMAHERADELVALQRRGRITRGVR